MVRRLRISAGLTATFLLWSVIVTSQPALANYDCGTISGQKSYFDGYGNDPVINPYGVSAHTIVRPGQNCTNVPSGGTSFVTAWALLASNAFQGHAQSGYILFAGSYTRAFSEWQRDSGASFVRVLGGPHLYNGEEHKYTVRYTSACPVPLANCFDMEEDSQVFDITTFNPDVYWVNRPWHTQYSTEATYQASDTPGSSTSKTAYTSMVYQNAPAQSWVNEPCGYGILAPVKERSDLEHGTTNCYTANFWTTS